MGHPADNLQLAEPTRSEAIDRCRRWAAREGLALPNVEPLVLDFGLGRFEQVGLIEFWISNELAAGYCGKYMFVEDGQTCPLHQHRAKHETFFVIHGKLAVSLDDDERILNPGESLVIAPRHRHAFRGVGPTLMLELSTPCEVQDNQFDDPQTMAWLRAALG